MDAMRARIGCTLIPSTSCVARLVSLIPPAPVNYRRIIVGDAWLSNVATAVEVARRKPVAHLGSASGTQDSMSVPLDTQDMVDAGAPTWNDHYVRILKNGQARYPKDYIKAALHGKAAGTQIVLTATVDGVDLVAVGWKQTRV